MESLVYNSPKLMEYVNLYFVLQYHGLSDPRKHTNKERVIFVSFFLFLERKTHALLSSTP